MSAEISKSFRLVENSFNVAQFVIDQISLPEILAFIDKHSTFQQLIQWQCVWFRLLRISPSVYLKHLLLTSLGQRQPRRGRRLPCEIECGRLKFKDER